MTALFHPHLAAVTDESLPGKSKFRAEAARLARGREWFEEPREYQGLSVPVSRTLTGTPTSNGSYVRFDMEHIHRQVDETRWLC
jgi:hypothetical protein